MTSYRYGRRLINTLDKDFDELYAKKLEERGQRRLEHLVTPSYSAINPAGFTTIPHVWKTGDHYYKLAHEHYGDVNYWWVIAYFNNRPTEGHVRNGVVIYIPFPPEKVAQHLDR